MGNKSKVPDWLPDWRDDAQYPDHETATMENWAWEFLRRNPEYQADYLLFVELFHNEEGKYSHKEWVKHAQVMQDKYQLAGFPPDPANKVMGLPSPLYGEKWFETDNPTGEAFINRTNFGFKFLAIPTHDTQSMLEHRLGGGLSSLIQRNMDDVSSFGPGEYRELPYFSFRFNLALPVEEQVTFAKEVLQFWRKKFGYALKQRKKQEKHYRTYLRILDAKAKGVRTVDIARELNPHVKHDKVLTESASDTVRKGYEAAQELRDQYLTLIDPRILNRDPT